MNIVDSGENPGFCPDSFISLADACVVVGQMHTSAKPRTVRKFLIGAALHGNQSGLAGYAERFEESFVRLDRAQDLTYRKSPEAFCSIPADFWRIGMALSQDAVGLFKAGNLSHSTEMTVSELPYRMRDQGGAELQNERVCLSQSGWGVHFPREHLLALAEDPQWQAWGDVALALRDRGKRGRAKVWKWDAAKAALTIEAARNPEILQRGPGTIVQFINDQLRHWHFDQIPDRKEVDAYVKEFSVLWQPLDKAPPTD